MSDPSDYLYQQLWQELFGEQGHRRGHVTTTAPFAEIIAFMTKINPGSHTETIEDERRGDPSGYRTQPGT